MKNTASAVAILAATTLGAHAGGVDRSGQNIGIIFEQGNYVEFSYGTVGPDVSGVGGGTIPSLTQPTPGQASGNMSGDYSLFGLGYKHQFSDDLSFSLIFDQPFGANVNYPVATTYFARGSTAELNTTAITGLLRYKLNDKFSVHGGLRFQSFEAEAFIPFLAAPAGPTAGIPYQANGERDYGLGWVAGVAYEKPEIALRVALTYSSEISHSLQTTESGPLASPLAPNSSVTEVETPQSLNLDFQTGIAANTLLFGSIRWVDWTNFRVAPNDYGLITSGGALVSYENDSITYNLGVGRRFNENWSGAISLGYEKSNGGFASNLGPTDGNHSIGVGVTYTQDNMKITTGVRYIKIGDANTRLSPLVTDPSGAAGVFTDNEAVAFGFKVGFGF